MFSHEEVDRFLLLSMDLLSTLAYVWLYLKDYNIALNHLNFSYSTANIKYPMSCSAMIGLFHWIVF